MNHLYILYTQETTLTHTVSALAQLANVYLENALIRECWRPHDKEFLLTRKETLGALNVFTVVL